MVAPAIPIIIAAVSAATGAGVSAHGKAKADKQTRKEEQIIQQLIEMYGDMEPQQLEAALAYELGPSAMEAIQTDPAYRDAQLRALASFEDIQESGGLTLADKAAQNTALNQVARREAAGRQAIQQNMAARGTLGSGAELAMSLQNQQGAASRANEVGMNTAAAAQARYFDSILAQGNMAGGMRDQDFNEKSQKAQAADMIARYNTAAKERALNQRNSNAMAQWHQQLALKDREAGGMRDMAAKKQRDSQATRAFWGGVANTITGTGTKVAGMMGGGGGGGGGASFDTGQGATASNYGPYAGAYQMPPAQQGGPGYAQGVNEETNKPWWDGNW